jgi:hypothetical protein
VCRQVAVVRDGGGHLHHLLAVVVQRLGMRCGLAAALADGLDPVDRGVHVLVDVLVVVHGGADHLLQLDEAIHAAGQGANLVVA